MLRRDFLRATVVLAGALVGQGCAPAPELRTEDGSALFPQSVASGDPRPESVVLWTRVEDATLAGEDVPLVVEVSTSTDFTEIHTSAQVTARARNDHCAKVKITGLAPATTYHYRFILEHRGVRRASRTGRTRTAPRPEADTAVRFAFISGQDYRSGHYNALLLLAREELDFVLHLGDAIHETTSAQDAVRKVTLTDVEGALCVEENGDPVLAAASLDNYRELYRTYRSDPALQAVHERFPVIAIWGDHEFSNDCHGATGTYFNERVDEEDARRRKSANQAWFEYQPVDYGDEGSDDAPDAPFPGELRIHRTLAFGRHVHLVLTDLRAYRPDHLVPEGAVPGEVVLTHGELQDMVGTPDPEWASPYLDLDAPANGMYRDALVAAAPLMGYDPARIRGDFGVPYINAVLERLNATLPASGQIAPVDPSSASGHGVSFLDMGKLAPYSALGARRLVGADNFNRYAWKRYLDTDGRSEQVMGPLQEPWFLVKMRSASTTWKIWANGHAFSPLVVDLGGATELPEALRRRCYLDADAWDGFPNRRRWLLRELAEIEGVVILTGGARALLASALAAERDPWDDGQTQEVPARRVVEIVGPAVSSAPLGDELGEAVASEPVLGQIPGAAEVAGRLEELLTSPALRANPHLAVARTKVNGYVTVEADGEALTATARLLDPRELAVDLSGQEEALAARVETVRLRTRAGTDALERETETGWERWSPELVAWVRM